MARLSDSGCQILPTHYVPRWLGGDRSLKGDEARSGGEAFLCGKGPGIFQCAPNVTSLFV